MIAFKIQGEDAKGFGFTVIVIAAEASIAVHEAEQIYGAVAACEAIGGLRPYDVLVVS